MGSQVFENVTVPVLWGTRAVLQDRHGRLSIVDLSGPAALTEIVGDLPAPGVTYRPTVDGFVILSGVQDLYNFDPTQHKITAVSLDLPECEVAPSYTRVGGVVLTDNKFTGVGVGILVWPGGGFAIGGPLPPGLASLQVA